LTLLELAVALPPCCDLTEAVLDSKPLANGMFRKAGLIGELTPMLEVAG